MLIISIVGAAFADDSSTKRKLLGYWKSPRHGYLIKSDGIMYMLPRPPCTTTNSWDVNGGYFYQDGERYTILAINKLQFVYQSLNSDHTVFTLTRTSDHDPGFTVE